MKELLRKLIEKARETEDIFEDAPREKIYNNLFDMYLYMDRLESLLEKQQGKETETISLCCGHVVLKKDFQNAGDNCPTCEMDKDFREMCGIKE